MPFLQSYPLPSHPRSSQGDRWWKWPPSFIFRSESDHSSLLSPTRQLVVCPPPPSRAQGSPGAPSPSYPPPTPSSWGMQVREAGQSLPGPPHPRPRRDGVVCPPAWADPAEGPGWTPLPHRLLRGFSCPPTHWHQHLQRTVGTAAHPGVPLGLLGGEGVGNTGARNWCQAQLWFPGHCPGPGEG